MNTPASPLGGVTAAHTAPQVHNPPEMYSMGYRPKRSVSDPTIGENRYMPQMWNAIIRPITPWERPPSSMCNGVSDMTPTIVTWLTIMAATASRAAGLAQMRPRESLARGRSCVDSSIRPMPPATARGSGRSNNSTMVAATTNISPDRR
jgi:hypothetical protein